MKAIENAVRRLGGVWPSDDVGAVHLYKLDDRYVAGLPGGTALYICTRTEFEECTKRLRNEPSWDDAPDWSVAKAQSTNGLWYWLSATGEAIGDWKQTLRLRPEEEEMEDENDWHKRGQRPPVGTICQMTHPGLSGWITVEILLYRDSALAPSGKTVVVCAESEEEWPMGVAAININTQLDFRPLQTERERWVDSAERAMRSTSPELDRLQLAAIYDAGLAKMPEDE